MKLLLSGPISRKQAQLRGLHLKIASGGIFNMRFSKTLIIKITASLKNQNFWVSTNKRYLNSTGSCAEAKLI